MLISSRLSDLGGLLRASEGAGRIEGKGVESVRSKVANLAELDWIWEGREEKRITHETFVRAVVESFRETYGIDEEPVAVEEDEDTMGIEHIRDGMAELKVGTFIILHASCTFAYRFGTELGLGFRPDARVHLSSPPDIPMGRSGRPYTLHKLRSWLNKICQVVEIHSKGGIILSCKFKGEHAEALQAVAQVLKGRRYAFVGEEVDGEVLSESGLDDMAREKMREVWRWLAKEMDS